MKRNILAVIFIICIHFCVFAQNSNPIDLVLVLNNSTDISPSYENVNNYITGNFLSEYLRIGDTFHLISFSSNPKLEIARRISGIGDIETIIGRMLLQYPVESGSNLSSALSYTEQYVSTLPSRPKKIIVVSTAVSDVNNLVNASKQRLGSNTTLDFVQVTPGQALSNLPSSGRPQGNTGTVAASTPVTSITTPTTTTPSTGTSSTTTPSATTPSTTTPSVTTPSTTTPSATTSSTTTPSTTTPSTTTSSTTPSTTIPSTTTSSTTTTPSTGTSTPPSAPSSTGVSSGQTETTSQTSQETSASSTGIVSTTTSETSTVTTQTPAQTTQPDQKPAQSTQQKGVAVSSSKLPLIIALVLLLLLLLDLIIYFLSRKSGSRSDSSPKRVDAAPPGKDVASRKDAAPPRKAEEKTKVVDHNKDMAKYAAAQPRQRITPYSDRPVKIEKDNPLAINPTGPLLLNLFVEDQNTNIGKRNIHSLKSGYSLSVGGGNSDFLIFLVPVPANIGELHRNASQLTFIPRKHKYFPDLGSSELRDCLNKTIRIISDRGYEIRFRFEMYEDPLTALNRILNQIKVPG
jgi:hypothetical protein